MKAVRIHTAGGPDAMKYEDAPQPEPKAGEAVVKVDAAGLNYIDVYFRSGQYKANLPLTLGMEAGGNPAAADERRSPEVLLITANFASTWVASSSQHWVAKSQKGCRIGQQTTAEPVPEGDFRWHGDCDHSC